MRSWMAMVKGEVPLILLFLLILDVLAGPILPAVASFEGFEDEFEEEEAIPRTSVAVGCEKETQTQDLRPHPTKYGVSVCVIVNVKLTIRQSFSLSFKLILIPSLLIELSAIALNPHLQPSRTTSNTSP